MVTILRHGTARPCIHHTTNAISLRLKVPVEVRREVSKLSRYFSRSIPIEIDLVELKVKMKRPK